MMKKILIVIAILVILGLAGCASQGARLEMAYTAVPLTQTQMAMYATPTQTPVPDVVAFAVAVEQARATSAAMQATMAWVNGQMTATAWARDERATAQAIRSLPAGRQDVPPMLPMGVPHPRIEVVDATDVREWLDDVERQAEEVE